MTLWLNSYTQLDSPPQALDLDSVRAMPKPAPIDAETLARTADYRGAAIAINREHARAIGRLAMAMLGTQAEADDALQETLLQVVQAIATFRSEGTLRAWVFGIARRVCAKRLEVRIRQENRTHMLLAQDEHVLPTPLQVEQRQEAQRVRTALAQIKPTEREALLLRYEVELSYGEIAIACGVDEPAARKRVSRGLLRLKELLAEHTTPTSLMKGGAQ